MKPTRPREIARRDVEAAVIYYRQEAGVEIALGFVDAVERTLQNISRRPSTGSPRYAHEVGLPGLRSRSLGKYPYLIFYIERPDHIEIWRVLHTRRDIPRWLAEPEAKPPASPPRAPARAASRRGPPPTPRRA